LVQHGGDFLEQLAVLGVDGGEHHDLVAGADVGFAEPAAGGFGVLEAAVAVGDDDPGGVGLLRVAAGAGDVVFDVFVGGQGDGVGEHDFAADQDEVVDGGDADDVAVFEQELVKAVGAGEQDLAGGLDAFGAVDPLQHEVGFAFAQLGFFFGAGADGEDAGFEVFEGAGEHFFLAGDDALPEQLQAGLVGAVVVADFGHEDAQAGAVGDDVFLGAEVFAFDAHGDGALLFVGGEVDGVAAAQGDAPGVGERVVFDVEGGAGVAGDAHVGGGGVGPCEAGEVGDAGAVAVVFEAFGVGGEALDFDALLFGGDEDDVAVAQLDQGHFAFEDEVVEVECGAHLVAAFDLDVEEGAAFKVDAAGLVEVVQEAVHAGAAVEAGAVDEAADEDAHGLGGGEAGVAVDVGAVDAAHGGVDDALEVLVADAEDLQGADVGHEDVALGVDGERGVVFEGAPEADLDVVADGDGVVGVEVGGAFAGEGAGEEVGAEDVAGEVGAVVVLLRREDAGHGHGGAAGRDGRGHDGLGGGRHREGGRGGGLGGGHQAEGLEDVGGGVAGGGQAGEQQGGKRREAQGVGWVAGGGHGGVSPCGLG